MHLPTFNHKQFLCYYLKINVYNIFIMEFDYEFYLATYPDLKNMDEKSAYSHWLNHGIAEGRICSGVPINNETHVTMIIHLFNESLFSEFLTYIKKVKIVFSNVNVLFTINENSKFDEFIHSLDQSFTVIKVENKGVDVFPFLQCIKYIRQNKIKTDFILKMHTKESNNETENYKNWRKDLIKPIVDVNNLYVIQHYFKTIKNIGYIGAQKCILPKNYDLDFHQNIDGLNLLCARFTHLEKDWKDFNAGNMFWISNQTLSEYLTDDLMDYLIPRFSNGRPPCNSKNKGIFLEYLCERLFTGIFCYKKTNILVNEFQGTRRGVGKTDGEIDHSYFYQPSVFSIYTPSNIITN